jgi:glycosyltransferase involved in cell wall biosynthesis
MMHGPRDAVEVPDLEVAGPGPAQTTPSVSRVVAIVPGDDFSGPAGQVASTAIELAKHGVEVRFLLLSRPARATGRLPAFLAAHGLPCHVLEDRRPLDLGLVLRVRRFLSDWQPDVVETHGYKATGIAFLLTRFRHRWRWVGYFHGLTTESRRARFYHALDLRMLASADRAVTISEEQRQRLARWAPDVRVIPSAVTTLDGTDRIAAPPEVFARVQQLSRPHIGVVGRLSPEKGVDVFLRAAALLAARGVAFSAVIVGDGPARSSLTDLTAGLGLADRVHFLGHLSEMQKLYEYLDLLVIPSRSEGLPSVLLEALHADIPVVSTRVGAIPGVIVSPQTGTLVPPDSPAELADGIVAGLASRGSEPARLARRAAARAFSQERRAASLLALYREIVVPSHSPPHDRQPGIRH